MTRQTADEHPSCSRRRQSPTSAVRIEEFREFRTKLRKTLQSASLEKAVAHFEGVARTAADSLVDRAQQLERGANGLTAVGDAAGQLHERTHELASGTAAVQESLREQAERMRAIDLRKPLVEALAPASTAWRASMDDAAISVRERVDTVLQGVERQSSRLTASTDTVLELLGWQCPGGLRRLTADLTTASNALRSLVQESRGDGRPARRWFPRWRR